MNPNVRPSMGDRVRMGVEAVGNVIGAPFRAIGNFADRVGNALGVGGRVRDRANVIGDNVGGVGDRIRHGAQNLPIVGGMVDRVSPVREDRTLRDEHFIAARPGALRQVAEMLAREQMIPQVDPNDVQNWMGANQQAIATLQAEAVQAYQDAQDPAAQPQVNQQRAQYVELAVRRAIVANQPVAENEVQAQMAEAGRITPLTNEQYSRFMEQLARPGTQDIGQYQRSREALNIFRRGAVEHALHEYHDHHIRAELRRDGNRLMNEVQNVARGAVGNIDIGNILNAPDRNVQLRQAREGLEADPVLHAVLGRRDNITHPITGREIGNLDIGANREHVRRGVVYDLLGFGVLCYDPGFQRVLETSDAVEHVNDILDADQTLRDNAGSVIWQEPILDQTVRPPAFHKDALILKLQDGQNRENLVVLMELWSRMDGSGNFAENMSPQDYLQRLGGLRGVNFDGMLGQLGLTPQEIADLRTNMPSLFTVGNNHFGNELSLINEPAFDLLAVDNADAYNLFVDLAMLDEFADILTVDRNGRLVVDPTQVTPLNARVYNLIAHDLMNDRDVLDALVEQIMAQNPNQYRDINALPDRYFLTEKQATKELAPTLKKLEGVKDREAAEALMREYGFSPEKAMQIINKKERHVLKDLISGSMNGIGRILRAVAVMTIIGSIGGTAGTIISVAMVIYAAWNLLRGGAGMAHEAFDLMNLWRLRHKAEKDGDKEGADRFREEIKVRSRRLLGLAVGTVAGAGAAFVFGPAYTGIMQVMALPVGKAAEAITTVAQKGEINRLINDAIGGGLTPEQKAKNAQRLEQLLSNNTQALISSATTGFVLGAGIMSLYMQANDVESLLERFQNRNPKTLVEKENVTGGPKGEDGEGDPKNRPDPDNGKPKEPPTGRGEGTATSETIDITMADRTLPIGVERGVSGGHNAVRLVDIPGQDALEYAPGSSAAQALEKIISGDMSAKAYDTVGVGRILAQMFTSSDKALWTQQLGQDGVRMLIEANGGMTLEEIISQANKNPGGIWFPTKAFNNMMPTVVQPK